jgi:hypothetical protein
MKHIYCMVDVLVISLINLPRIIISELKYLG